MKGGSEGIGWTLALELAPAALFGCAAGFSTSRLMSVPPLDPVPAACGVAGFVLAGLALRLFRGNEPQFPLRYFEQAPLEIDEAMGSEAAEVAVAAETGELLLKDVFGAPDAGELLLEDALSPADPDSRVVRLFDPARMPTAGELQERIERHLRSANRPAPDATQELHEALSALRQSLR